MKLPVVAIIGRPNVGKSTLFNHLTSSNIAITSPVAGTTRDRIYEYISYGDSDFMLVDTGGIEDVLNGGEIEIGIQDQVALALEDSDIVLFLVDSLEGLNVDDKKVAQILRESGKTVIFVASKSDKESSKIENLAFTELGMGEPISISVKQKRGIRRLEDSLKELLPEIKDEAQDDSISVCFVGRPNVGKSSMVNALIGEERQIVSEIPGTTRDANSLYFDHDGKVVKLIDTAGVRKSGKVEKGIEKYSVFRSLNAISRSDVAVLVIDAIDGITSQDMKMASMIRESNVSAVIAINKWDLVPEKTDALMNKFISYVYRKLDFLEFAPCMFVSAKTGQRVSKILDDVIEIEERSHKRITTNKLNAHVETLMRKHAPSRRHSKKRFPKLYYVSQTNSDHLEFVFFINYEECFHPSYFKYLERGIREKFELHGVGVRFLVKAKGEDDSKKVGEKSYAKRALGRAQSRLKRKV